MKLCLAIVAAAACVSAAPALARLPATLAVGELLGQAEEITGIFLRYQERAHVPGITWGIVRDGRLIHQGASGVADVDSGRRVDGTTLFRIASMTKAFTALAILKLRDEGRLALDDSIARHVPEARDWRLPSADSRPVTIRDLLNHVGGFVTDDPWGDRQTPLPERDFTAMLRAGVPFTRPPRTAFEYSNFGYALLGRIVAKASGRPWRTYVEQELFGPLGMAATGVDSGAALQSRRAFGYRWENEAWVREPDLAHGAFSPMGGIQTSLEDYARWVGFLLSAWPPRDDAFRGPVARATVRELASGSGPPLLRDRPGATPGCRQSTLYGMGMIVAVDCEAPLSLAHGGGYPGYGSYVLLFPEAGIGLFAFANRTYAGPAPAIWDAAMVLHRAGLLAPRGQSVSEALATGYAASRRMWAAGSVDASRPMLAMNFLLDRSAASWAIELSRLKREIGGCAATESITATGALSGRFVWACERGRILGQLLLAPTRPPTIQALRLEAEPTAR